MWQKYILIIITILNVYILKSQSNTLVIFSSDGDPFLLQLDGRDINLIPQSNVKAYDLNTGWHKFKIAATIQAKDVILNDSVLFVNETKYNHKEFTYALVHKKKNLALEFKSVSEQSGPPVPIVPDVPKVAGPVIDNSIYGNLYKAQNNKPVFYQNYDAETDACKTTLTEKDITHALNLLKTCNDEERQMSYMKKIVAFNCYTTVQLQQMLLTFPLEIDRLALAKSAYSHLTDKNNILQLYPVFKYQAIKDNYSAFIKEQETVLRQQKKHCGQPASNAAFDELLTTLSSSGNDSEKLNAAKKAFINVCLLAEQVKKITQLFTHDREKLECLKCAYAVIVDKDKTKELADQLQFTENKEEFLRFISK